MSEGHLIADIPIRSVANSVNLFPAERFPPTKHDQSCTRHPIIVLPSSWSMSPNTRLVMYLDIGKLGQPSWEILLLWRLSQDVISSQAVILFKIPQDLTIKRKLPPREEVI